jgi:CDP-glucose 4,6-dehydratase
MSNCPDKNFWSQRRVLVTGHTGFKGGWLYCWLRNMGAEVLGYSLEPDTRPNIFSSIDTSSGASVMGDLCDYESLRNVFLDFQPEVVFHLAAQPLVRRSYNEPRLTYMTNVIGTQNVLESVRLTDSVKVMVSVTTDKVYENREWDWGYRERDALGGHDPYSSSKACADILTRSYRRSYFSNNERLCHVFAARAGNVVGGGDWAEDRIVPDAIKSFMNDEPLEIRNPCALRPWQHVIEPLAGYLMLAERYFDSETESKYESWNFGPPDSSAIPVVDIANILASNWGDGARVEVAEMDGAPHEAGLLKLDSSRAIKYLGWGPIMDVATTLAMTVAWYQGHNNGRPVEELISEDIEKYLSFIEG